MRVKATVSSFTENFKYIYSKKKILLIVETLQEMGITIMNNITEYKLQEAIPYF